MSAVENFNRATRVRTSAVIVVVCSGITALWASTDSYGAEKQRVRQSAVSESQEELIRRTKTILLVETTEKRPSKRPEYFDFKFKVLRVVKGEYNDPGFEMTSVLQPGFGQLISGQPKDEPLAYFDQKRNELRMTFGLHEKYLIFVSSKNAYGYQRISSETDDRWLNQVEKLVGQ